MIRAIVTDIEGTTSSISFVKDVLFPYASEHLAAYIKNNQKTPEVQEQLEAIWLTEASVNGDLDGTISLLRSWIDQDLKKTPLKSLQGMIWRAGYEQGDYQAHIYEDAAQALQTWHQQGLPLYVYSSGSIAAQQLFFTHSEAGNLSTLFSDFFDTTTGPKQSPDSYKKIASAIGFSSEDILFLSDIPAELDAASAAGMQTCMLVRPQDCPLKDSELAEVTHQKQRTFDEIALN